MAKLLNFIKTKDKKSYLLKATWFLAAASVVSNILGLIRDRIFVWRFGAGNDLDAYYAAFRLPDLIFNFLVLGALFSAFVPIFTDYITRKEEENAWHVANSLINIFTLVLIFVCGLFFLISPKIIFLIAPGFINDPEKIKLTVNLTRLLLLTPLIFSLSNIFSGILNSFKKFFAYALAPVVYNLGIILGGLFLVNFWGIYGLGLGVILGSFFHFLVQMPSVLSLGYRFKFVIDFKHPGVRQIFKLMVPTTIALGISQINLTIYTILGSFLRIGSIAIVNLANNIQTFPTVVFGISVATTVFPYLAENASLEKIKEFIHYFSWAIRQILFLIIPATAGMILLRAQIIRLILGASKFTWSDTQLAASVLGFFVLSLAPQAIITVLVRSFYAFKNTKTPLFCSFVSALLNIILAYFLVNYFGYENGAKGLALAFSLSSFLQAIILIIFLKRKIGALDEFKIIISILKIIFITFLMSVIVYGTLYLVAPLVNMQKFWGIMVQTICAIITGIVSYLFFAWLLHCEEMKSLNQFLKIKKQES